VNCPRCPSTVLDERERDGIQIDGCPKCRGIWLDRGELERLIALTTSAMDAEVASRVANPALRHETAPIQPAPRYRRDDDDDDDDRYERQRYDDRGQPPRRKRWFEVFDIFD